MDNYKEQKQLEKRKDNAKKVLIIFPIKGNYQTFNVVDENGALKYDGFVTGQQPADTDDCKCPSFTNNNFSKAEGWYKDTRGHAFQCKHIIAAREEAFRQTEQTEILQKALDKAFENDKTHTQKFSEEGFESRLVDRSLLL